jgi:hypothetical protein
MQVTTRPQPEVRQAPPSPTSRPATPSPSPSPGGRDRVDIGPAEQDAPTSSLPNFAAMGAPPQRTPEQIHRMQYRDPVYNPGGDKDDGNGNCGPTSVVMALDRVGITAPGATVQDQIDGMRRSMFPNDRSQDGVGRDGRRNPDEHIRGTTFADMQVGAEAAGARTRRTRTLEELQGALRDGHPVIINGNPTQRGSYGERAGIGNATDHIVALTGYDAESRRYTVNDPLHQGPLQISEQELRRFYRRPEHVGYGMVVMPGQAPAQ